MSMSIMAAVLRDLSSCRRRRRAYTPTSNTASHDNHEKINSRVSCSFLYEYGAPLGGPSGRRSSAKNCPFYQKGRVKLPVQT